MTQAFQLFSPSPPPIPAEIEAVHDEAVKILEDKGLWFGDFGCWFAGGAENPFVGVDLSRRYSGGSWWLLVGFSVNYEDVLTQVLLFDNIEQAKPWLESLADIALSLAFCQEDRG